MIKPSVWPCSCERLFADRDQADACAARSHRAIGDDVVPTLNELLGVLVDGGMLIPSLAALGHACREPGSALAPSCSCETRARALLTPELRCEFDRRNLMLARYGEEPLAVTEFLVLTLCEMPKADIARCGAKEGV